MRYADRTHVWQTGHMKNYSIAAAAFAAFIAIGSASAAQVQSHGGLPLYPHTYQTPVERKYQALMQKTRGNQSPLFVDTNDAQHMVDLWYRSNLPASCKRRSSSRAVQYRCPNGLIDILPYHGKIRLALIPQ